MADRIAVLDFGSQYTQVIARRVRENRVFSEILPFETPAGELRQRAFKGIILSGGPASVLVPDAPSPDARVFELGIPVLGICYGLQLMGLLLGGEVAASNDREYGQGTLGIRRGGRLFSGIESGGRVWNSHGDRLVRLPPGFEAIAQTENSDFAAIEDERRGLYGLQFHPEVAHTQEGAKILGNFLFEICRCAPDWTMDDYIETTIREIRRRAGDQNVVLGVSGGVDSSVAAALIDRAIGRRLTCIFVDNGLLRKNERQAVLKIYQEHFDLNLKVVRAGGKFLSRLRGVKDPEKKRKLIGKTFIEVFQSEITKLERVGFLAQGTLYPDIIESVPISGNPASLIKSHHNVGGLPKGMKLKLIEPLKHLFKDEVRALGATMGLPKEVLFRQPFPGPGLAVRIVGEITRRRLKILREADSILIEEMKRGGFYYEVWQSFAVFLPVRTVGVMGDARSYENVVALRIVESSDAMTVDWARLPYDLLQRISGRIINEVKGVNRVCLDISSKPPSTIEWE